MLKSNVTKKLSVISAFLGLLTLFTALNLNFGCYAATPKNHKPSGYPLFRATSVVPNIETNANQPNNSDSDFDDIFDLNSSICIKRLPKTETTNETNSTRPNKQDSDSDEILELKNVKETPHNRQKQFLK